jgi:nucleoside-diphosphate-sugar epimerase
MNSTEKPVAIVTGASSGIGLGITLSLIKHGYDVVGTSRTISKSKELKAAADLVLHRWPLRRPDTPGKYHLCRGIGTLCKSSPWQNRPSNHAGKQRPPTDTFGTEIEGTPRSLTAAE